MVPFSSSFIIIENNKLVIRYDKFSALSNVLGPVSKFQFSGVFFNQTIFMLYIMNLLIALNYIPRASITRLID